MKYTIDYCKQNKVAIQVNSEEELKELYNYFLGYKFYERFSNVNNCYLFNNSIQTCNIDKHWFSYNKDYQLITFQQFMQSQTKKLEEFTDKDVIHCPTEELAVKICKLLHDRGFIWGSGATFIKINNWDSFKENTCYLIKKGEYASLIYYENKGYTIYKAEDILALYEEKQIYTMLETQKIIGYKAPYDLAGGMVKKGTIYKKVQEDDRFYAPEGKISKTTLPKEIVETWEAVYEDELKVGDWIYFIKSFDGSPVGHIAKITSKQIDSGHNAGLYWIRYSPECGDGGGFRVGGNGYFLYEDFRKATQNEIDSLFTKTLTLNNGKVVCIQRGIIIAQNETIELEDLKGLIKWSPKSKLNNWGISLNIESFDIGCWKKVKISDLELIIKTAEEQIALMKD